jgi:hypothetical protein
VNFCENLGYGSRLYVGQFVLDELIERGLARTPENEKLVRVDLRKIHGPGYLASLARPLIARLLRAGVTVLVDAVASVEELECYKTSFSASLELVAIESSFESRIGRLASRGARAMIPAEIRERDDLERIRLRADLVLAAATIRVSNDSSLDEFYHDLRQQLRF